jgi:hypothetical protein
MGLHLITPNSMGYKYFGDISTLNPKQGKAFLDKISLTLSIPDKDHQKIIEIAFKEYAKNQYCRYASYSPHYKRAFYVCLSEYPDYGVANQNSLFIQFDPRDQHSNFLRCEWNPSKVNTSIIKGVFDNFLIGGYDRLMKNGEVTRADTAIDIHNVSINSLIFYYPKFKISEIYRSQKGEEVETIYLGDGTAVNQLAIYNKTAQWKKENNKTSPYSLCDKIPPPNYPVTRIEHRYRPNPSCKVEDLTNTNIFDNLTVSNYIKLQQLDNETVFKSPLERAAFKCFLDSVRLKGLQSALKIFDDVESIQKKFRKIVKSATVAWYQPNKIKEELPALIKSLQHPKDLPLPFYLPKFTHSHSLIKAA